MAGSRGRNVTTLEYRPAGDRAVQVDEVKEVIRIGGEDRGEPDIDVHLEWVHAPDIGGVSSDIEHVSLDEMD